MEDRDYDVVIAGGGPAGNEAAYRLASQNYDVLVLENDSYVGETKQSTGGTFPEMMASFGIDPDETTMSQTSKTVIEGPEEKLVAERPGYVLEFGDFKRYQADRAQENGADYLLDSNVIGLEGQETSPSEGLEVVANTLEGQQSFHGDIVVDATGANAVLGKDAGLVDPDPELLAMGIEYEMEGVEMEEPGAMVLKVDYDYAPGGYAWIFDTGDDTAKVGVCGYAGYKEHYEDERRGWEEYFDRFVEEDPRLEDAEKIEKDGEVERHAGKAYLQEAEDKMDDNLLLTGDTISSIDPVWGEGIHNSMISGREAAVTASRALEAEDYSAENLSRYEDRWETALDNRAKREKLSHFLYGLDDETVDHTLRVLKDVDENRLMDLTQSFDRREVSKVLLQNPDLTFDVARDLWGARNVSNATLNLSGKLGKIIRQ